MQWDYQWRNTIQNSPAAEVKSAVEGLLQRSNVLLLKAEATRCTEQLAKRCDVTQENPGTKPEVNHHSMILQSQDSSK